MKRGIADELGKALVRRGAWLWNEGQVARIAPARGAGGWQSRPEGYLLVDVPPEMVPPETMRELGVASVVTARTSGANGAPVMWWPDLLHPNNAGWLAVLVREWTTQVEADARELLAAFPETEGGQG